MQCVTTYVDLWVDGLLQHILNGRRMEHAWGDVVRHQSTHRYAGVGRCLTKHASGVELRGGGDIGGTASRCVVLKVAVSEGTQSRGKAASFTESNLARIFLN